jgi:Glutaminase
MFKVFVTVIVLFVGSFTFAKAPSAFRPAAQSWKVSKQKFEFQELLKFKMKKDSNSALDSAVAYDKVDINQIPEFAKSADETQKLFEDIRNVRFLEDPDIENFSRRVTWLYPVDGCFARAEWAAHLLKKNDPNIQFSRVFIFGDLKVNTQNSEDGYVTWWYHVGVIIRHQGKAFVFDPSLELTHPIELSEWVQLQVPNPSTDAELAICSGNAYDPGSDCEEKSLLSDDDAADEISPYLRAERRNLNGLGRDPDVELGDNPPW